MGIEQEVEELVYWLKNNSGTQDLVTKLRKTEELAGASYYVAKLVGDAADVKNSCEYMYKTSLSSYVANTGGSQAKNEVVAKDMYKDLYKDWMESETIYKKLQLKLAQIVIIIEQSRQSIAHLKREYYDSQTR